MIPQNLKTQLLALSPQEKIQMIQELASSLSIGSAWVSRIYPTLSDAYPRSPTGNTQFDVPVGPELSSDALRHAVAAASPEARNSIYRDLQQEFADDAQLPPAMRAALERREVSFPLRQGFSGTIETFDSGKSDISINHDQAIVTDFYADS